MAFQGYLFKSATQYFPLKYIEASKYSTTPNHREEVEAYRDDYTRALYRVTAPGHPSSFKFTTRDNLKLSEVMEIKAFFNDATTNANERKVYLTYWNMEDLVYKTSYFYYPDITYTIKKMTSTDIIFNAFDIELVEYDPLNATTQS